MLHPGNIAATFSMASEISHACRRRTPSAFILIDEEGVTAAVERSAELQDGEDEKRENVSCVDTAISRPQPTADISLALALCVDGGGAQV